MNQTQQEENMVEILPRQLEKRKQKILIQRKKIMKGKEKILV